MTTVRIEKSDNIAVLRLNRPPVNAIDLELLRDAEACFSELRAMRDLGAVVITGTGKCFCAGLDLKAVPQYGPAEQREMVAAANRMMGGLYMISAPTVAAVNGHAIAGGLVLALACDYRVGADAGCRIGLTEARVGIPFPVAAMEVVKAELAPPVVRRLTLVAKNMPSAAALDRGILDELRPAGGVLQRASEVARDLATIPKEAYGAIKRQFRGDALARIERAVTTGSDPLLDAWLTSDTKAAAAEVLSQAGANREHTGKHE